MEEPKKPDITIGGNADVSKIQAVSRWIRCRFGKHGDFREEMNDKGQLVKSCGRCGKAVKVIQLV